MISYLPRSARVAIGGGRETADRQCEREVVRRKMRQHSGGRRVLKKDPQCCYESFIIDRSVRWVLSKRPAMLL